MIRTSILTAACTAIFLSAGAFLAQSEAASNSGFMKQCSDQWQSMKTAGTVPAGQKWSDFLKTCSANAQGQAAAAPAATPVVPGKKPSAVPAAAASAAPAAPAASATAVANAAPASTGGSLLKKIVTGVAGGAAAAAPAAAQPPVPGQATTSVASTGGNQAPTATDGAQAEQARIKECGVEWKNAKAANKVPQGQAWPQFWSACDARLKAHG